MEELIEKFNALRYGTKVSLLILIISNLTAILGAIFLGWDWGMILLAYWMENGIIGFFTIIKMITSVIMYPEPIYGRTAEIKPKKLFELNKMSQFQTSKTLGIVSLVFTVPFLVFHFGGFMLGHLIFIVTFILGDMTLDFASVLKLIMEASILAITLFISHSISFYFNFIKGEEFRSVQQQGLVGAMYGRVAILHIVIIFGAFIAAALSNSISNPMYPAILLIVIKTFTDVVFHLRERKKIMQHN